MPDIGIDAAVHDELEIHDRIYLERLRLAIGVLLQVGEDPGALPNTCEVELFLLRERVERALLLKPGTDNSSDTN